jgi:hypothetical protein
MVWVTAEVDVDLDSFDDEDIRNEYNERGLGPDASTDDLEVLTKIWLHDREGRKDEAYALMREYVLDKLNKVV